MAYSPEIAAAFIKLYSTADYSITEISRKLKISRDTFYHWKRDNEDFAKALIDADVQRTNSILDAAEAGLKTVLTGKEYVETRKTYEYQTNEKGKRKKVLVGIQETNKIILPVPQSVAFALKNLKSEVYSETLKNEVSGPGGGPIPTTYSLTDEQFTAALKELRGQEWKEVQE